MHHQSVKSKNDDHALLMIMITESRIKLLEGTKQINIFFFFKTSKQEIEASSPSKTPEEKKDIIKC